MNKNNYTITQMRKLKKSEIDLLLYLADIGNPINLTNKEIASVIGVNCRTVNRGLNTLRRLNYITVEYGVNDTYLADRYIIVNETHDE